LTIAVTFSGSKPLDRLQLNVTAVGEADGDGDALEVTAADLVVADPFWEAGVVDAAVAADGVADAEVAGAVLVDRAAACAPALPGWRAEIIADAAVSALPTPVRSTPASDPGMAMVLDSCVACGLPLPVKP